MPQSPQRSPPSERASPRGPARRADWPQSGLSNTLPWLARAAQNSLLASLPATPLACAPHIRHTAGNGGGTPPPRGQAVATLSRDAARARAPHPTVTYHTARSARAARQGSDPLHSRASTCVRDPHALVARQTCAPWVLS